MLHNTFTVAHAYARPPGHGTCVDIGTHCHSLPTGKLLLQQATKGLVGALLTAQEAA